MGLEIVLWEGGRCGDKGLAHGVVLELVDGDQLQGKGYVVVTDNFYTSPALFRDLQQRGFGACGTTRRDRRGIPPTVRDAKLQRGEIISSRDNRRPLKAIMLSLIERYWPGVYERRKRGRRRLSKGRSLKGVSKPSSPLFGCVSESARVQETEYELEPATGHQ